MLTECQEQILNFVREFRTTFGVSPSTRKVAAKFDIAQATALAHLRAIGAKGFLVKMADGRWGLGANLETGDIIEVPILGSVPAGRPQSQEESIEDVVKLDSKFFGLSKSKQFGVCLLRVQGNSMINANIKEGDLVILVRRKPNPGEIIAALVDDNTTTLKRLVIKNGRHILRAANPQFPDIVADNFECQGVAVGLIRNSLQFRF